LLCSHDSIIWRAFAARTKYDAFRKFVLADRSHAATTIQSVWRLFACFILQRYFIRVRSDAAATMQSVWRASFSGRKEHVYRRKCVVMIQSSYRGHKSYLAYKKRRASSITVQRHVKGYHARTHFHLRVQHLRNTDTALHPRTMNSDFAAVRIQTWWRMASSIDLCEWARACYRLHTGGLRHGSIANA
jgi:hypothetical protein